MRCARNKSIVEIGEEVFKLIIKYDVIINRIPNEIKAPRNTTHDKCSTVYRIIIHVYGTVILYNIIHVIWNWLNVTFIHLIGLGYNLHTIFVKYSATKDFSSKDQLYITKDLTYGPGHSCISNRMIILQVFWVKRNCRVRFRYRKKTVVIVNVVFV